MIERHNVYTSETPLHHCVSQLFKSKRSDDDEETLKINVKMSDQPENTVNAANLDSWKRLAAILDGTFFLMFLIIELALAWNYIFSEIAASV